MSSSSSSSSNETKKTLITAGISFGFFLLGSLVGAHRTRRRQRRNRNQIIIRVPHIRYPQARNDAISEDNSTTSTSTSLSPSTSPNILASPGSSSSTSNKLIVSDVLPTSPSALDCPVCLSDLLIPRIANCGHTICTPCLMILYENDRRPQCPVCRQRIKVNLDKLCINFAIKTCVEDEVSQRGPQALTDYRSAENKLLAILNNDNNNNNSLTSNNQLVEHLRPAWNWFKWSVIIVTEFGAFLVSLKELVDTSTAPPRNRRYQRIV